MRLISEERQLGTIKLLFSSPISITEIVLGKFLGITIFYLLILLMITLMPLSLFVGPEKLAQMLLTLTCTRHSQYHMGAADLAWVPLASDRIWLDFCLTIQW